MMKIKACCMMILAILCFALPVLAKDVETYIDEARELSEAGKPGEAVALLQQAVAEHPGNADLYAYLGLHLGRSAGHTGGDYMEAMRLLNESFAMLDKAVSLAPENYRGYVFRGIIGVQIPKMLGKLDGGIADLRHVIAMHEKDPVAVDTETLISVYTNLATGYEKEEHWDGVQAALEKVIALAPGTETAVNAEKRIAELPASSGEETDPFAVRESDSEDIAAIKKKIEAAPENAALIMELGKACYDKGEFGQAVDVLKRYVDIDNSSAEAYKLLGISVAYLSDKGYDENIHEDTDYLSMLAFQSVEYMDRAAELDPGDPETRLVRGIMGVMFPFFLGKHEQGVGDLEFVVQSEAPDSIKAEALYYLGVAKQKEATRYWIDVVKNYPDEGAARMVFGEMRPPVKHFDPSGHERPFVAIDFVLGFRDELPPQTAVWIENGEGSYVTTVYVSGFSGYAKAKQINLPVWSEMSKFEGVEAVTSASIDVGHHIYTWDLEDMHGKRIPPGTYTVKVEVSYWPSMKYQRVEGTLTVGKKEDRAVVEEGDFIPRLAVEYYPD
jgi:tetratricopeptide (TPR) repeat protein